MVLINYPVLKLERSVHMSKQGHVYRPTRGAYSQLLLLFDHRICPQNYETFLGFAIYMIFAGLTAVSMSTAVYWDVTYQFVRR
jgi:hypothetical protein